MSDYEHTMKVLQNKIDEERKITYEKRINFIKKNMNLFILILGLISITYSILKLTILKNNKYIKNKEMLYPDKLTLDEYCKGSYSPSTDPSRKYRYEFSHVTKDNIVVCKPMELNGKPILKNSYRP